MFISPTIFQSTYFSFTIFQKSKTTKIVFQVIPPLYTTLLIPQTCKILGAFLPSIHFSSCYNKKKLPFRVEVKNTEIGHLFEHILLQYIYQEKAAMGDTHAIIRGETSWNWEKDPRGLFYISINIGKDDSDIVQNALYKATLLTQRIVSTYQPQKYTSQIAQSVLSAMQN